MLRNLWLRLLNPSSTFSVRPQSSQNSSNLNPQRPPPQAPRPQFGSRYHRGNSLCLNLCSEKIEKSAVELLGETVEGRKLLFLTSAVCSSIALSNNLASVSSCSALICEISVLQVRSRDSSSHGCSPQWVTLVLNRIGLICPMGSLYRVRWWLKWAGLFQLLSRLPHILQT